MYCTQSEIDRLLAKLEPVGKEIGKQAHQGDLLARRVMQGYDMLILRPEPAALAMVEKALDDWIKHEELRKNRLTTPIDQLSIEDKAALYRCAIELLCDDQADSACPIQTEDELLDWDHCKHPDRQDPMTCSYEQVANCWMEHYVRKARRKLWGDGNGS